jgi:ribosomal protein L7Ae-like RNA K-turn-binding protein
MGRTTGAEGGAAERHSGTGDGFEPLLRLLGLGVRAGNVLVGVDGHRNALQHDQVICVVLAADASERAREKVARLALGKGIPLLAGPDARTLGDRLGRPPVQAVGVKDRALADGVVRAARPWASGGTIG